MTFPPLALRAGTITRSRYTRSCTLARARIPWITNLRVGILILVSGKCRGNGDALARAVMANLYRRRSRGERSGLFRRR